jgi:hypothetical protein
LYDPTSRKVAVSPPKGLAIGVPDFSGSPTAKEIEFHMTNGKIMDLEKLLMDKNVRIEYAQKKYKVYAVGEQVFSRKVHGSSSN